MSKTANVPGGDDQNPGGTSEQNQEQTQSQDNAGDQNPPRSVSYDSYKKAVDEAKAAKKKADELERKEKQREEAALAEQGNYKKLLEQRETELKDERKKYSELNSKVTESRKMNAFLGAVSGEIPDKYWGLVDLDAVAVDPETGKPDEASVKAAAEAFEKQYPDVVKKPTRSKLPNDAPNGGSAKLKYVDWLKLPDDQKAKRMKDVDKTTM